MGPIVTSSSYYIYRKLNPQQIKVSGRLLLFFCLTFSVFPSDAQSTKKPIQIHNWFDDLMGAENNSLYNGIGYTEKYKVINKYHKFFKTTEFLDGEIVFEDLIYPVTEMKYDVDADELLINHKKGQRLILLRPIKKRISEFDLDGHHFIHLQNSTLEQLGLSGFYELLWQNNDTQLLEKHFKKRFQRKGNNSIYHEFKSRNWKALYSKGKLTPLRSKKDILKLFPDLKKEIKPLLKKLQIKSSTKTQWVILFQKILKIQRQSAPRE